MGEGKSTPGERTQAPSQFQAPSTTHQSLIYLKGGVLVPSPSKMPSVGRCSSILYTIRKDKLCQLNYNPSQLQRS